MIYLIPGFTLKVTVFAIINYFLYFIIVSFMLKH